MISMLGDAQRKRPGGFLLLDEEFNIAGRWEKTTQGMNFNYDFWYQPRHNVMVSSEWAAPKTFSTGFDPQRRCRLATTASAFISGIGLGVRSYRRRPRRKGNDPAGSPIPSRSRQHAWLRWRGLVQHHVALVQEQGCAGRWTRSST